MCCKASQEHNLLANGHETRATDTIYHGMSILIPRLCHTDDISSLTIMEVTATGTTQVDLADLCWNSDTGVIETGWVNTLGYWLGSAKRPVARESMKVRRERLAKQKQARSLCAFQLKGQRKNRKSKFPVQHVPTPGLWTRFNYPLQPDVLLSFVECHKPFNKWRLLGTALGKRAASHRDVMIERHMNNKVRLYSARIHVEETSNYQPPPTFAMLEE
jgi:hypothetical protein